MQFEWDEPKRLANIEKHGLDFLDADLLFGNPHIVGSAKIVDGETRKMATGMLYDVHVTAIYTMRGDTTRIISFRRANHGERRRYQELLGG